MTEKLPAVQQALENAHEHSTRPGKWSTVPDVKNFEENTTLTSLRRLVKQGAASEKVKNGFPLKLFKPTRSGAGAAGLTGEDGDKKTRGKDRGKTRGPGRPTGRRTKGKDGRKGKGDRKVKPKGDKPGKANKNPMSWKNPKPGDAVKNTLNTGIATLLVGGMGSSIGGGAGVGSVPKVGAFPTIRA